MADHNETALDQINMGVGLMQQENYAEAKAMFEKALQLEPDNYDAHMHLGNACVNLGEMESGILSFTNALMARPDSGEALFSIGNVYYLQNDLRKAIKYYNKAEAVGYQAVDMYLIMAEIFRRVDDGEQVLRCLNRALKQAPLRGELWRQKVLQQLDMGKLDDAQETLDEFSDLLPDALDAYDLRVKLLCGQGKYEQAGKALQPALERFPEDPRLYLLKLHIFTESEQTDEAAKTIALIREKGWDTGRRKTIAMEEARLFTQTGDTQAAAAPLRWALEETPEDPELLYLLLNAHVSSLDYSAIIVTADKIVAIKGIDPSVLASAKFYRALSLQETGKTEQAKSEFRSLSKELRKITIEKPGLTNVYMLRLLCHCSLEEYDKALELADYLQNIAPDSADGHAYKHLIYKQMGNTELAAAELAEARKINPAVPE